MTFTYQGILYRVQQFCQLGNAPAVSGISGSGRKLALVRMCDVTLYY